MTDDDSTEALRNLFPPRSPAADDTPPETDTEDQGDDQGEDQGDTDMRDLARDLFPTDSNTNH